MNDFQSKYDAVQAELEKAKAEAAYQQCNSAIDPHLACGSALGGGITGLAPARPGLRERVDMNLSRTQQEAGRADALCELQHLLDKHPYVARILDSLEVVGIK